MEAGNGDLPRLEAIRADPEHGEARSALIDRRLPALEARGVGFEVTPESGGVGFEPAGVLTHLALGDDDGSARADRPGSGEFGSLEQGEDVFGLDVDDFSERVSQRAAGIGTEFHHAGRVVLEALTPGERTRTVGEGERGIGMTVGHEPVVDEGHFRRGRGGVEPVEDGDAFERPRAGTDDEQAGFDRDAEPRSRIDPNDFRVGDGEARPVEVLQDPAGDGGLAEESDRRVLAAEFVQEFEPDGFGDVEVRGPGLGVEAAIVLEVRLSGQVLAAESPERRVRDPGGIADHEQGAGFLGAVAGGFISDTLGKRGIGAAAACRIPIICGLLGAAIFTAAGALATATPTAIACMACGLFAANVASSCGWALAAVIAPGNTVATLEAIQNVGGSLGGTLAPFITGTVVQATGSFTPALLLAAMIAIVSAMAYGVLGRRQIAEGGR